MTSCHIWYREKLIQSPKKKCHGILILHCVELELRRVESTMKTAFTVGNQLRFGGWATGEIQCTLRYVRILGCPAFGLPPSPPPDIAL
jgi:hypothetical protein